MTRRPCPGFFKRLKDFWIICGLCFQIQQPMQHTLARGPHAATCDWTRGVFVKEQARERKETKLHSLSRTFPPRHEDNTRCEQSTFLTAAPQGRYKLHNIHRVPTGGLKTHSGRVLTQNTGCYSYINETFRYARFAAPQNVTDTSPFYAAWSNEVCTRCSQYSNLLPDERSVLRIPTNPRVLFTKNRPNCLWSLPNLLVRE